MPDKKRLKKIKKLMKKYGVNGNEAATIVDDYKGDIASWSRRKKEPAEKKKTQPKSTSSNEITTDEWKENRNSGESYSQYVKRKTGKLPEWAKKGVIKSSSKSTSGSSSSKSSSSSSTSGSYKGIPYSTKKSSLNDYSTTLPDGRKVWMSYGNNHKVYKLKQRAKRTPEQNRIYDAQVAKDKASGYYSPKIINGQWSYSREDEVKIKAEKAERDAKSAQRQSDYDRRMQEAYDSYNSSYDNHSSSYDQPSSRNSSSYTQPSYQSSYSSQRNSFQPINNSQQNSQALNGGGYSGYSSNKQSKYYSPSANRAPDKYVGGYSADYANQNRRANRGYADDYQHSVNRANRGYQMDHQDSVRRANRGYADDYAASVAKASGQKIRNPYNN